MKDRLEELMKTSKENFVENVFDGIDNPAFEGAGSSEFDTFFNDVTATSSNLNKLEKLVYDIRKQHAKVLCSTAEDSICKEKKCLKDAKCELTHEAKVIQSQLDGMKTILSQKRNDGRLSVEYRIRQCQFNALVTRYREILTFHYTKEIDYVGRLRQQIVRQTQLAGLQLQDEVVDRLVENPAAPQIVGQDLEILKAKEHLALSHERHKQLLALESQIAELHRVFLHFAVLVTEQQEVINSIEYNVLQTVDYISPSSEHIKKAVKYQKKSRATAAAAAILSLCACAPCIAKVAS
ncbi:syntaxin-3-like [Heptranchias perlo]|uniref:syntaxin-3-like n=1 Tax=Heptranchias perlo TaxID=212740 RepID=UPI0035593A69